MTDSAATPGVGIAFDIGTTTVAGASVEPATGKIIRTGALPNPQAEKGLDVLARIKASEEGPEALKGLSRSIVGACNHLIRDLAGDQPVGEIIIAGNTVMEHIFLNISPASIAKVPYRPAFRDAQTLEARSIGLDAPGGRLYVFPVVGGFVGGDAVAAALSLGLKDSTRNTLVIDIGTNSEIILGVSGRLSATSAAAGPAFEAGGTRYGMTAERGAIEGVRIEGDNLRLEVIGGVAPKGICGSGLIEAAAALLKAGVIETTGRIRDDSEVSTNLSTRIKKADEGNAVVLYRGASAEITLTQADVRALQVAKSAIRAGVMALLKKAELKPRDVDEVCIAGAFGSNLNTQALVGIGMLDPAWTGRVRFTGDAALDGAVAALREEKKKEAEWIAKETSYVPLSGSRFFEREFIRNMDFPSPSP